MEKLVNIIVRNKQTDSEVMVYHGVDPKFALTTVSYLIEHENPNEMPEIIIQQWIQK